MIDEPKMTAKGRRQLARMLAFQPDADFLAGQTEESLNSLKAECDQHWTQSGWFSSGWTVVALSVMLAMSLAGYLLVSAKTPVSTKDLVTILVVVTTLCTLLFMVALTVLRLLGTWALGLDSPKMISEALQPMSEAPFFCDRVLESLTASAQARAYRDRVVAQGRELRVADGQVIFDLAEEDHNAYCKAHHRKVCQQVHGLLPG